MPSLSAKPCPRPSQPHFGSSAVPGRPAPAPSQGSLSVLPLLLAAILATPGLIPRAGAQAPAPAAPAPASQRGTVKSVSGSTLTLATDAGKQFTVTLGDTARILQIAPGSTDLKSAQTIQLTGIAVGDRVLVSGKPTDASAPDALTATRVILMKSTDIAEQKAAQQADWQKRGSGGIVSAVDPATGTITVANGARKTAVTTTGTTIFRRYAGDSVRFEDAQPGTVAQIQPGDQVRVRGAHTEDGSGIQAEEIVSGTFRNLAGTIASVDPTAGTLTIKDLATKKNVVVKVTANSDFRKLPPEMAARLARPPAGAAAQGAPGAPGAAAADSASGRPAGATSPIASTSTPPDAAGGRSPSPGATAQGGPARGGPGQGTPGQGRGPGAGGPRSGSRDLSQMIGRLPTSTLAELKPGEAVMIVASQSQPGAASVTAITMLSGVEPLLAASPSGSPAVTLSPFGFGGGAPEMGGGGGQ